MDDTILLYITAICSVVVIVVLLIDWWLDILWKREQFRIGEKLQKKILEYNKQQTTNVLKRKK